MANMPSSEADSIGGQEGWTEENRHRSKLTPLADNTEKTNNIYKVLLKFMIPKGGTTIVNQFADVNAVLEKLFDQHEDFKIISINGKYQIGNKNEIPSNAKAFEAFFGCETIIYKHPTKANKGEYSTQFQIESMKPISAIKNETIFQFLSERNIYLTHHELTTNQTACMAIITKKHTKITNIQSLAKNLKQRIYDHLTENNDIEYPEGLTPNLAVQLTVRIEKVTLQLPAPTKEKPNNRKSIESKVFCIYTNKEHAINLGNFLANESIFPEEIFGQWIPWSARIDKELFANKLREHNLFESKARYHVIEGISYEMMMNTPYKVAECDYESTYNAIYAISETFDTDNDGMELDSPYSIRYCDAPEPTSQTENLGRWYIPYVPEGHDDIRAAQIVKAMIVQWQQYAPMSAENRPRIVLRNTENATLNYIRSQRNADERYTPEGYDNDNYNRSKIRTSRPPGTVVINNSTNQPTWTMEQSHAQSGKPSYAAVTSTIGTPASTPQYKAVSPSMGSSLAGDTAITSQRTGFESIMSKINADTQKALAEQKATIATIMAHNKELERTLHEEKVERIKHQDALGQAVSSIHEVLNHINITSELRNQEIQLQLQSMQQSIQANISKEVRDEIQQLRDLVTRLHFGTPQETLVLYETPPRPAPDSDGRAKRNKPSTPTRDPPSEPAAMQLESILETISDEEMSLLANQIEAQNSSPASKHDDGAQHQ